MNNDEKVVSERIPIKGMVKGFSIQLLINCDDFAIRIKTPIKKYKRPMTKEDHNLLKSSNIAKWQTSIVSSYDIEATFSIINWQTESEEELKQISLALLKERLDIIWNVASRINKMASVEELEETVNELFEALPVRCL